MNSRTGNGREFGATVRLSRRSLLTLAGSSVAATAPAAAFAQPATPEATPVAVDPNPKLRKLDFSPYRDALDTLTPEQIAGFDALLLERSITEIDHLFATAQVSSFEMTLYYLDRIERYDVDHTNAVLDLDPHALDVAQVLDDERAGGTTLSRLHGIPILLKDNISTAEGLYTTTGAAALVTHQADRDAFLVRELREAGAIILGKTNLTEWANWMHVTPANGFSAVGGQTSSPYGDWIDPSGSSTGSAVAVSMNLAPLAIGTETIGSIVSPSARSSVVGMKPSVGLVSRDYVIPISDEVDTAGPIARNVSDVAIAMDTLASDRDAIDHLSSTALPAIGQDFSTNLQPDSLQGIRVGLVASLPTQSDAENLTAYGLWDDLDAFQRAGAEVIMVRMPAPPPTGWPVVLNCDMHLDVNRYLQASGAPFSSLLDITTYNDTHPEFMPFGQGLLNEAVSCSIPEKETHTLGLHMRQTMSSHLETIFEMHNIQVLASIDDTTALEYCLAGWPAVTVPRLSPAPIVPSGLTFVGPYLSDAELLGYAYAYEQESKARKLPILVTLDPVQRD